MEDSPPSPSLLREGSRYVFLLAIFANKDFKYVTMYDILY
jgi:hypothetical protein